MRNRIILTAVLALEFTLGTMLSLGAGLKVEPRPLTEEERKAKIAEITALQNQVGTEKSVELMIKIGELQHRVGKTDEAVKTMREALRHYSDNAEVNNDLACYLTKEGKQEEALIYHKRATSLNKNKARYHIWYSATLFGLQKNEEAEQQIQIGIKLDPKDPIVFSEAGLFYFHRGNIVEAEKNFKIATSIEPSHFHAFYNYGAFLGKQERFSEAVPILDTAVSLEPNHKKAKRWLAYAKKNSN